MHYTSSAEDRMESLKGLFPFRLGTTSYIVPDEILPNVRYLSDKVDDIELVLFESDEISNIPDADVVSELIGLACEHDLTYTVHLPLDAYLGHGDEAVRTDSVGKCLRIIERTLPLDPFSYVIHFHGDKRGKLPSDDIKHWQAQHRKSMEELLAIVPGRLLSVETLDYPFGLIQDIVSDLGLSVCLDIGHVLMCGYDLDSYLKRHGPTARVFHLHGIVDGVDHRDISHLPDEVLSSVLVNASYRPGTVMTLEVFSAQDFHQSIKTLGRYRD